MKNIIKQRGAVSLFVVIFAALLLTVVTISFVRIMVQSQQQASSIDLSQSAYDSAQVGVEDAKRALLRYQKVCSDSPNPDDCNTANDSINSKICDNAAVATLGVDTSSGEVQVQTNGSNTLNQAYTCVKIITDTVDVEENLLADKSTIIPLKSLSKFDSVNIEWFTQKNNNDSSALILEPTNTWIPLFDTWDANTPPIIRTQLFQFSSSDGFTLDSFNKKDVSGTSNANTVFLYPSISANSDINFAVDDVRQEVNTSSNPLLTGAPIVIECSGFSSSQVYACNTKLILPEPIGGTADNRTAFLRLTSLYKGTTFRLTLSDTTAPSKTVFFNEVQPLIDSTGRANDKFRRVKARVKMMDVNYPFPNTEIDITGNLCKDFLVTDVEDDYDTYNNSIPAALKCNP